jgi:hypothetical protein
MDSFSGPTQQVYGGNKEEDYEVVVISSADLDLTPPFHLPASSERNRESQLESPLIMNRPAEGVSIC